MSHTLLIGNTAYTWREWIKAHRGLRDLISLDPSDANLGVPGRLVHYKEGRPHRWRFYGSLDPLRSPHVIVGALAEFLREAPEKSVIQLYNYRATPLLRQLTAMLAQLAQPSEILIAPNTELDRIEWPVGPEEVELDSAFPDMVQGAQRKAQWLKLLEGCEPHEVDLRKVAIEGARLGAGKSLLPDALKRAGVPDALYGEVCGNNLLVVSEEHIEEAALSRALDVMHCTRATVVEPVAYRNLLCSFARHDGEDFGMGVVQEIDFTTLTARILCTAVPPAPIRILRMGSLRVAPDGREMGEARPWQV